MSFLKRGVGPFLGGIVFALGLGVSGMTEPAKIIAFLDIFGEWDPSLIFVMVGAIGTHAVSYRLIKKRNAPLFETKFYLPSKQDIDKNLLLGSAIFGIGWGISGLCPGPGISSVVTGSSYSFAFVLSLLTGMTLARYGLPLLRKSREDA